VLLTDPSGNRKYVNWVLPWLVKLITSAIIDPDSKVEVRFVPTEAYVKVVELVTVTVKAPFATPVGDDAG
jgi:hypothetical protein